MKYSILMFATCIAMQGFTQVISTKSQAQTLQQKIDERLSVYQKKSEFNGVALVSKKGTILFEKTYGFRDAERKIPHDINDIFLVGSVTKQFTAAVIVKLQEEGKLSVTDRLSKFYPDYPNGDKITIENLLTHTSGIYNFTDSAALMQQDPTQNITEEKMLSFFKDKPLQFEPGTKFQYNNSAYNLLGYIIQKCTGKLYQQVVREKILIPLQMTSTGFDFTHLENDYKSKGYTFLSNDSSAAGRIVDSTISFSTGGLYTTAHDLYKWERAISNGMVLQPTSWKLVFTPHLNHYGYGWYIDSLFGKQCIWHSGGNSAFAATLYRFPEDEATIILLDNASARGLDNIAQDLAGIVYNQTAAASFEKKQINLPPEVLQQYAGQYEGNGVTIVITVEGDHLLVQTPDPQPVRLYPFKDNFFFAKEFEAQAEFVKDVNGKIIEHIVHLGYRQIHYKKNSKKP